MLSQPQRRSIWGRVMAPDPRPFTPFRVTTEKPAHRISYRHYTPDGSGRLSGLEPAAGDYGSTDYVSRWVAGRVWTGLWTGPVEQSFPIPAFDGGADLLAYADKVGGGDHEGQEQANGDLFRVLPGSHDEGVE